MGATSSASPILIIGIIITAISTIVCPIIASSKGRSVVGWLFGGFLLGGIGLIIVACLSNLNKEAERRAEQMEAEDMGYLAAKNQLTPYDEIRKLKELLDMGAITQEEFDQKKKQLL